MQPATQPTPPPAQPEDTGNKKIVTTISQAAAILFATIGSSYFIINSLSERENKLRDEINKVADNLTALDASIKQVEASGQVAAQKTNNNFTKLQGRLEVIEKNTKVFVPPALTIPVDQAETEIPKP
jgi:septation ring formation regulator EzrA